MNTKNLTSHAVYRHSADYAMEHRELHLYKVSFVENMACRKAMEQAFAEYYRNNSLLVHSVLNDVRANFGDDRIGYVLAATIACKLFDERFSDENRLWAKKILEHESNDVFNVTYGCAMDRVHPGLLNLFVNYFREETEMEWPADKSAGTSRGFQVRSSDVEW